MSDTVGIPGDIFGIFGGGPSDSSTSPNTTPTDGGTNPTSSTPSTSALPSLSASDIDAVTKEITSIAAPVEDLLHGFGIGAGSAATQAAAAQAAQQQQLLLLAIGAVVVGVVLYKLGYLGGGKSAAAPGVSP